MQINLQPCPFCGSKDVGAYYVDETGAEYAYEGETKVSPFIKCHGCDSEWFSDCYEAEDVLKAWNRRYDHADSD